MAKLIVSLILLTATAFIPFGSPANAASLAVTGWAWSDTIGWIQFDPVFGGVFIDDATGDFSGYAWSDNIGWIDFAGTNLDWATGEVTGWANAIAGADYDDGWTGDISMSGISPDYSVNVDLSTGEFSGWAWGSDVVGWISFGGAGYDYVVVIPPPGVPTLNVSLSAVPSSGNAPLTSTLTAVVSGTAAGNIDYKFDCEDDGIYETEFTSANESETYDCVYSSADTYTAMVYAARGGLFDEDRVIITVSAPETLPAAPSELSAIAGTGDDCETIFLTWIDNSDNETKFEIERNSAWLTDVGANITSYQDIGLTGGATYTYRVRAYNSAGYSDYSNTSSAVAEECVLPADFTLLSSNDISAKIIEEQDTVSTDTTITVINTINFSDNVVLSSNVDSVISGATDNFSDDTLDSSEYSTGSTFNVNVPGNTAPGSYIITIQGNGGLIRTVDIELQLNVFDFDWEEF